MTHPQALKNLALAPVAVGIDLNLQRLRGLQPGELIGELELELDRPEREGGVEDRKQRILEAALRNVELHGWQAAISDDGVRLRLHGGSVSLELGLSESIWRFIHRTP